MEVLIIIVLIMFSCLMTLSEYGLVSSRKVRLDIFAKKEKKSAKRAIKLLETPIVFLSATEIGNTFASILVGLFSGDTLAASFSNVLAKIPVFEPYSYTIAKIVIVITSTYMTIIIGQIVPKRIAMGYPEQVAMLVSGFMTAFSKLVSPFIWLLSKTSQGVIKLLGLNHIDDNNKVTEEEIRAVVQEGYKDGEVQEVEQDIVERVFHLGDRTVGTIMTHRNDLVWIDVEDGADDIRRKVNENLYNTYPVISEKIDNIKGVVFLKDLFGYIDKSDFSLSEIIRPAHFVQENMSVYKTLESFRENHLKYSIVTDEFGGIQGIVTLKDVVEALIGELPEAGEEAEIIQRKDGSLLVDGQYSFYSFLEYFDMEDLYNENDYNTLSGLILQLLERVPKTGDKFSWMCFDFEIVDMDGARIDKVLVRKKEEQKAE